MVLTVGLLVAAGVGVLVPAAGATAGPRTTPSTGIVTASGGAGGAPDTSWVGIRENESRWLHERQLPDLVPFGRSRLEIVVDSIHTGDGRAYSLHANRPASRRAGRRAGLRIDGAGELVSAWVAPDDMADRVTGPHAYKTADASRARTIELEGGPLLHDAWVWDIAPLEVPALRPGATTRDTVRYRAERFGFLQSTTGPRVTTLLRDTVVGGHRLWVGRDSARVEVRERVLEPRRSLDTLVVIEREAAGTLRGRFLYDPATGLFRSRSDSLLARGTATLRLPDGRVYRTGATLERRTTWTLRSAAQHREWEQEDERRRRRDSFSIVRLPNSPLQQRLAAGDAFAVDSLLRAWKDAAVDERRTIAEALRFAGPAAWQRLDSLRMKTSGPGLRVRRMASRNVWGGPPVDSAAMAEYLRFLRDPGLAFSYRLDTDPLYENLSGGLVMHPPTLGASRRRTSCTPAACRLVAAETGAAEPRLRQVALVARFILEPERWADSLLAREDTAAHLLHPAVLLARGVGATWPAAEKRPIPGPGAGWREWRRWTGVDARSGPSSAIRWGDSHAYAIRMTERLTGRDIGAELVAALDTTAAAPGRSVLRTLALHVGAIGPSIDEIAGWARAADPGRRAEARTALGIRRADRQPADSTLQHALARQLLAQAVDGDSIWTAGPEGRLPGSVAPLIDRVGPTLHVAADHLPAPLRAEWDARPNVSVITAREFRGQPSRSPGLLLEVGRATTLGPFAWIGVTRSVREARDRDQGPRGWASGAVFTLLRTDTGWLVVAVGEWVT